MIIQLLLFLHGALSGSGQTPKIQAWSAMKGPPDVNQILIIRHAERFNEPNVENKLTPEGIEDAKALAPKFSGRRVEFVASPVQRAVHTASLLSGISEENIPTTDSNVTKNHIEKFTPKFI